MNPNPTESPASFAKRVHVSHQVISRAITSGRLAESVRIVGRRRVIDVELGLREWHENRSREPRAPRTPKRTPESIRVADVDDLSVFVMSGRVVVMHTLAPEADVFNAAIMMTPRAAAALAAKLLELTGGTPLSTEDAE